MADLVYVIERVILYIRLCTAGPLLIAAFVVKTHTYTHNFTVSLEVIHVKECGNYFIRTDELSGNRIGECGLRAVDITRGFSISLPFSNGHNYVQFSK